LKKNNEKDIDEIIDQVIQKNKEKLDKLHKNLFEGEHFSLKNKKGDVLYYLRKKPIEKEDEEETQFKKQKSRKIKFGKSKKNNDIKNQKINSSINQNSQDILSSIEGFNKDKSQESKEEEIIDKKILEKSKIDNLIKENIDKKENIELNQTKNHSLSLEDKENEYLVKKDRNFESKKLNEFLKLLNKYQGRLSISNLVVPKEEIYNIKEKNISKETKNPILEKNSEKTLIDTSKQKKSFFGLKKKKEPQKNSFIFSDKVIGSGESSNEPLFKVENIPKGDGFEKDEADLIDKKIKDSPDKNSKNISDKGESKALQLATKHIKENPSGTKKDMNIDDTPINPFIKNDDGNEHVFFDEEGSSASSWTPQKTEKGKRMVPSAPVANGELGEERLKNLGEVELPNNVLQTKSVKLTDLGFSEKEWQELDFYSLQEPFAYVEVLQEKESLDKCYFLVEIALSQEEEELLNFVRETMSFQDIDPFELEEKNEDEYLLEQLNNVIKEYNIEIMDDSKKKIYYYMRKKSIGLSRIDPFMRDPNIEDISCDGSGIPVFLYHRKFGSLKSNIRFTNEEELSSFVFKLAQKCNKHISIAEPMIDATMPDGSRIQMTLSDEVTKKGSTFTIRKFRADPFSPPDLVEFNTMSSEMIAYMWFAIENGINTLFAGGTASGKTTALNALSLFIPRESKIVSIEETREINLPHPNWIPGVARSGFGEVVANKMVGEIDMYDLMKAALRQRPEYILVGEIRGKEAYVLFQAMATGHATYSTVHADSAQSLIHRLEGKPINIPRIMLQSMDIVCLHIITRVKNIRARRCKQIIEIIDIDPTTKEILTNEVFRWDPVDDRFKYSGKSYILERIRAEKDINREQITNEIKNRMKLIEWMNKKNIRGFKEVANFVAHYTEDPKEIMNKIK